MASDAGCEQAYESHWTPTKLEVLCVGNTYQINITENNVRSFKVYANLSILKKYIKCNQDHSK